MKGKFAVILCISLLLLSILACGSSSSIEVNPSDNDQTSADEVEPTEQPDVGTARSNPAPAGSEVVADDMAFTILGSERPADTTIMAANEFNSEPESDQEYILIDLQAECRMSSDEQCSLTPLLNISLIGSSGIEYDPEIMVAGLDNTLESIDFYGGATVSGLIPFIIDKSETDLVLVYEPILFGDTFYLEVP